MASLVNDAIGWADLALGGHRVLVVGDSSENVVTTSPFAVSVEWMLHAARWPSGSYVRMV